MWTHGGLARRVLEPPVTPITETASFPVPGSRVRLWPLPKLCGGMEATIVSFNIPDEERSLRLVIHRFLHGRVDTKNVKGTHRTYRYPGILDEGGFRVGQSVYLLPRGLASRFIHRLSELGVIHRCWDVMTDGWSL